MSEFETLLTALLNGESVDFVPQSRMEQYLKNCCDKCGCDGLPTPKTRAEVLLYQLAEQLAGSGGGGSGSTENRLAMLLSDTLTEVTAEDFGSATSVMNHRFRGQKNIVSVYMPNSVTSIGDYAFYQCDKLKSVTIPDNVTSIGTYAFRECGSLMSVAIGENSQLTSIGSNVFYKCTRLRSIALPNGLTSIPADAFNVCKSLESITIPNSVTSIGNNAFTGCSSLPSITIPDSVKSIGWYLFSGCKKLMSVTFGKGLTKISTPFSNCEVLSTIVLRSESVVPLENTSTFSNSPFAAGGTGGTVYCNAALIESYKTATNWSALYEAGTCNFVAIEGSEYE